MTAPAPSSEGQPADGPAQTGEGSGAAWKPPASQEELDRMFQDRVARVHKQYGMTPEQAADYRAQAESLSFELSGAADQAATLAAADAFNAAMAQSVPRLVKAEFKAEAKGVLSDEQTAALVEFLDVVDLTKFATDDGDADVDKIREQIAKLFPAQQQQQQQQRGPTGSQRFVSFGQGSAQQVQVSARDKGRAEAQKRFGAKTA